MFVPLPSRDQRESRWACGLPIEIKNDREMANCWRNSGRSSGKRFLRCTAKTPGRTANASCAGDTEAHSPPSTTTKPPPEGDTKASATDAAGVFPRSHGAANPCLIASPASRHLGLRPDLAFDARKSLLLRHAQVIQGLQSHPEFGARPEIPRQAQSRIGRNTSPAPDNLIQPRRIDGQRLGESIHAHSERLQDIFLDGFPGMNGR